MKITTSKINRKTVRASEDVQVEPEASELLFETEDVADLLAEATDEEVTADLTDEGVEFTVGDMTIVAEPEGDEEILESRRVRRSAKAVKASTGRKMPKRRVARR